MISSRADFFFFSERESVPASFLLVDDDDAAAALRALAPRAELQGRKNNSVRQNYLITPAWQSGWKISNLHPDFCTWIWTDRRHMQRHPGWKQLQKTGIKNEI